MKTLNDLPLKHTRDYYENCKQCEKDFWLFVRIWLIVGVPILLLLMYGMAKVGENWGG